MNDCTYSNLVPGPPITLESLNEAIAKVKDQMLELEYAPIPVLPPGVADEILRLIPVGGTVLAELAEKTEVFRELWHLVWSRIMLETKAPTYTFKASKP